jgi:hypothetical protein
MDNHCPYRHLKVTEISKDFLAAQSITARVFHIIDRFGAIAWGARAANLLAVWHLHKLRQQADGQ